MGFPLIQYIPPSTKYLQKSTTYINTRQYRKGKGQKYGVVLNTGGKSQTTLHATNTTTKSRGASLRARPCCLSTHVTQTLTVYTAAHITITNTAPFTVDIQWWYAHEQSRNMTRYNRLIYKYDQQQTGWIGQIPFTRTLMSTTTIICKGRAQTQTTEKGNR